MRLEQRFVIVLMAIAVVFFITTNSTKLKSAPSSAGPIAVDDAYTVHHSMIPLTPSVMANDSGNEIKIVQFVTNPQHGSANRTDHDINYAAHAGYVGPDSFVYKICDIDGLCDEATVSIDIVNQNPVAVEDVRSVVGTTDLGSFLANDFDPDGDPVNQIVYFIKPAYPFPAHGNLQFYESVPGSKNYDSAIFTPEAGYVGTDSFTYKACDYLNACSPPTTVSLFVISEGLNDGRVSCNARVGRPVNVTNGNVYLQQNDYQLPGVGHAINVTRTYNSNSLRIGLFGRGWTTGYDESIVALGNDLLRLNQSDGRAFYFGRPVGSSSPFAPLVGDFHGTLSPNGNGYTLALKDGSFHVFNSAGKLITLTDRNGNQTSLAYDGSGKLISVTDAFGRVLTVSNNSSGRVVSISDPMGTIATYGYSSNNQLLSVTYADNSRFQFNYDGAFRLTSVTDALGNILESHTYDAQGRALTSEAHGGIERYTLSYSNPTQTDVTDALGRVTKFTYDKSKHRNVVTKVEGLCGCGNSQVQTWSYDDQLNVTSQTNALNNNTTFTYDGDGNPLTETDTTGTVTFTYNQFGQVLTRTDQLNGVTMLTYDAHGNPLTATNVLGDTASFSYDARGLLLKTTDARGKVTNFAYDPNGNMITGTDALNHATQSSYDARSRLTSVTNALGHVTAFTYDGLGRLTQVTQADGSTIKYEYDLGGRRTAVIDAKDNRSSYAYDQANRLISETDALNQSTSYSYDSMSNLTSATDALGRVTNFEYDDFNRLGRIIYPAADVSATRLFETFAYNAAGNVTQRTDTAGRTNFYGYTTAGFLDHTVDANSQTTLFNYDALGRVTAVIDAKGQRYRFNYDAASQLRHIRRGATVMSFSYDPAGNRKTRTDYNGAITHYSYDPLNRLKAVTYPDGSTVGYTYDKLSRLQTASNENGAIDFDYNKMNRLTNVTDSFGQVVDYNYDLNGNRTRLTLNGATIATYRYDTLDRLTKIIGAGAFNFSYDATSKLTSRTAPNGVTATYQYDGLDRLISLSHKKGQLSVSDFQYEFNDAHNINRMMDGTGTNDYAYDLVDRLISVSHTNQANENYGYDVVGNRTSSHQSATYTHRAFNRLTSTANASYTYDTNGNLISKTDAGGTTQYAWDFENRLKEVTLANGDIVSYKYDALGKRIERNANVASASPSLTSERFIYDGADVIRDMDAAENALADYINGPGIDNKLRQTTATESHYFVQDHLGSTRALTNSTGNVVEQVQYDSFGISPGSALTRYTFTGRESDPNTGLMYYRARWYDPKIGRFISEDPIGLRGGINSFAYVSNNPTNAVDPSGLHEIDVHYHLTYYLALRTGCFSHSEAYEIARSTQGVDDNPETSPAFGNTYTQRQINELFHAFHSGSHLPYLQVHWQLASMGSKGNLPGLGIFLHYLQDMYSHEGFTDPMWGHSPVHKGTRSNPLDRGTHYTDKTEYDVPRTMRMAHATWVALKGFAFQTRRCDCANEPSGMWEQVESFARIPSGDFFSVRLFSLEEGHPFFLRNKVRVFNAPQYTK